MATAWAPEEARCATCDHTKVDHTARPHADSVPPTACMRGTGDGSCCACPAFVALTAGITSTAILCAHDNCTRTLRLEHNFNSLADQQTLTPALLTAANTLGWVTNPRTLDHYCPNHRRA